MALATLRRACRLISGVLSYILLAIRGCDWLSSTVSLPMWLNFGFNSNFPEEFQNVEDSLDTLTVNGSDSFCGDGSRRADWLELAVSPVDN